MLTHSDAHACIKMQRECAEMWDCPTAWQNHLTSGIEALIGGFGGLFALNTSCSNGPRVVEASLAESNTTDVEDLFFRIVEDGGLGLMPGTGRVLKNLLRDGNVVWCEKSLLGKNYFQKSDFYQNYLRQAYVGDILFSLVLRPDNEISGIGLLRGDRDGAFAEREISILSFVSEASARQAGNTLRLGYQMGRHELTSRQQEILSYLLEGLSEKEMAVKAGVSSATVHEHVGAIYNKFKVSSRAQLMSNYVARRFKA